jgi:hypothetical protein
VAARPTEATCRTLRQHIPANSRAAHGDTDFRADDRHKLKGSRRVFGFGKVIKEHCGMLEFLVGAFEW